VNAGILQSLYAWR